MIIIWVEIWTIKLTKIKSAIISPQDERIEVPHFYIVIGQDEKSIVSLEDYIKYLKQKIAANKNNCLKSTG